MCPSHLFPLPVCSGVCLDWTKDWNAVMEPRYYGDLQEYLAGFMCVGLSLRRDILLSIFLHVPPAGGLILQLLGSPVSAQNFRSKTKEDLKTKWKPHSVHLIYLKVLCRATQLNLPSLPLPLPAGKFARLACQLPPLPSASRCRRRCHSRSSMNCLSD